MVLLKPCRPNISEYCCCSGPFSTVRRPSSSLQCCEGRSGCGRQAAAGETPALPAVVAFCSVQYGRSDVGLWCNFLSDLYAELYCCSSLSSEMAKLHYAVTTRLVGNFPVTSPRTCREQVRNSSPTSRRLPPKISKNIPQK